MKYRALLGVRKAVRDSELLLGVRIQILSILFRVNGIRRDSE